MWHPTKTLPLTANDVADSTCAKAATCGIWDCTREPEHTGNHGRIIRREKDASSGALKVAKGRNLLRAFLWTVAITGVALVLSVLTFLATRLTTSSASVLAITAELMFMLFSFIGFVLVAAFREHDPDWLCWLLALSGPVGLLIALWRSGNLRDKKAIESIRYLEF